MHLRGELLCLPLFAILFGTPALAEAGQATGPRQPPQPGHGTLTVAQARGAKEPIRGKVSEDRWGFQPKGYISEPDALGRQKISEDRWGLRPKGYISEPDALGRQKISEDRWGLKPTGYISGPDASGVRKVCEDPFCLKVKGYIRE